MASHAADDGACHNARIMSDAVVESHDAYKKQRNIVKRNIEQAKRNYYHKLFDQSKNNAHKTWNCIKRVQTKKTWTS